MSDVNANIGIVFDTKDALASLRQLQAGLSKFNQSLTQGNVNAANAQKGLNAQLIQAINSTGKFVASQKNVVNSTTAFTDALEKNKLSMREYFRYTAAAATANTKVLGRAFATERDIINRARKDRVKALQTQYIQLTNAQGDLVKVLQVVPKHLDSVNGKYADYATRVQMAAQRQQLMNQLLKQGSTQLLNFGKNTQWAGRQLMVGLTIPLSMLGSFAAQTFREMEKEVVNFKRVYGDMFTDSGATDKAVADIQRLGIEFTKYGIAVKDTMAMASKAAAMGLTGTDLQAQVTSATKLSVLGQVEQQQALETTISLQNAFGISAEQLAQKINFLNAVENQTVLSIEDLTTAIPKAGPVVKQLGGSVEDLAFFMTAMKEGGINASEGANALKSGLASMINPSKKAAEFLADLGINIKGIVSANAGDLKATVIGFGQALDTLDPLNRARAIEQLFGKFQFARLSTLFQNVTKDSSQAATALGLAGASLEELAILSERELGRVEDSVGVKFQKTIEQLKVQLIPVGKAFLEALTPIVSFFGKVLEKFNGFSDGTKKAIAIVVGVVGGLAPIALMTFGLLANGLANLIKLFAMLRGGMAKLNGQNSVLGGGFEYLTQQEIENLAQSNALHTSHQNLIEAFTVETGSVNALASAYANASSQARTLAATSPGLFNAAPGATGAVSKLPKKFARGGVVPGTGNQDSVPSMLTPGEVVLTKDTVKENPELVAALMNGNIKKYNNGTGQENNGIPGGRQTASFIASNVSAGFGGFEGTIFKKRIDDLVSGALSSTDKGIQRIIDFAKLSGETITKAQTDQVEAWRIKMIQAIDKSGKAIVESVGEANIADLTKDKTKELLKNQPIGEGIPVTKAANIFTATLPQGAQQFKTQDGHLHEAQTVAADQLESNYNITNDAVLEEIRNLNRILESRGIASPDTRVTSLSMATEFGGDNRAMTATNREGQANYLAEYAAETNRSAEQVNTMAIPHLEHTEALGPKRFEILTKALGVKFKEVESEFTVFHQNYVDSIREWIQQNPGGFFNDGVKQQIFEAVRANAPEAVQEILTASDQVVGALRTSLDGATREIVRDGAAELGLPVPSVALEETSGKARFGNVEARSAGTAVGTTVPGLTPADIKRNLKTRLAALKVGGSQLGQRVIDGVRSNQGTDADSPSKKAEQAGAEVGDGLVQGMRQSEAKVEAAGAQLGSSATDSVQQAAQSDTLQGGTVVDAFAPTFYPDGQLVSDGDGNPLPPRQARKLVTKYKRGVRREKVGRFSGRAAGALGTASMVAGMAGAPAQVTGALGAASMVSGMAPALAGMGPVGWTVAGVTALGASVYLLDKKMKSAAEAQAKYVNSVSASTEKMKKIGEVTGKVGASEIMAKRRSGSLFDEYTKPRERKGQPFGETFLGSEVGKGMQKAVTDNIMKVGSKKAAQQLSIELASYISDGILTAEQANSIAQSIGTKLGDMTLTANIEGNLRSLIGVDGTNIFNDPIEARLNIVAEYAQGAEEAMRAMTASRAEGNSGRNEAAQLAAISVRTVELAQAQADAISKMYDDQVRLLEKELASTTNKEKQLEIETKLSALREKSASDEKRMNIQTDRYLKKAMADFQKIQFFSSGSGQGLAEATAPAQLEDAYFDSLKSQVKTKYKGTEQEDIAKNTMDRLARISDKNFGGLGKSEYEKQGFASAAGAQQLEVQMNLMMANGLLTPQQSKTMLDLFDGDLQTLQTNLNIGVRTQGAAKTAALLNMFGSVEKKTAKTFIANIVRKNPAEYDKTVKTLDMMTKLDGIEINMEVALEKMGVGGLDKLSNSLAAIQAIKGPITKEVIADIDTANIGDLQSFVAGYKDFEKLPDNIKKQALQLYTTIYSSLFLDADARKAWLEQSARDKALAGSDGGKQTYLYEYIYKTEMLNNSKMSTQEQTNKIAAKQTEDYIKWQEKINAAMAGNGNGAKKKGDNPLSFLDELAMRLKQVRDNAFNALKPIDALLAAFKDKKTQKNAFSLFDGIQNRLLRMGAGKDFRDAIASMSATDFATIAAQEGKNALFTFEEGKTRSKDTITGLAPLGQATDQGYRERNLGDYNLIQEETVQTVTDQSTAYKILIANGLSAARALEVVADAGQAAAIAGGAINATDADWQTYINNINKATDALERQKVLNDAIKANQEFADYSAMPGLVAELKEMGYSVDQIDTVLGNPELAKFLVEDLKKGQKSAKEITDYLKSIEARKIIDIQVKLNKGDLAGAAADGRQIVDELFAAQEGLIRTGPEAMKLKANERQIRDLESQIAPFRREIELINDEIEDAQRVIEESYSRPIEKLQEEVNDLSRELEVNPLFGDRAIKKIQDENNMLSNDLSIISHEAEKINEKYDKQAEALSKVQEINANIMEQQKQQLDLADALTQGDISAAAKAAQAMRQTGASQFATGQSDALEQARKNALDSLVGPQSGLTQDQINEKQFQNSQKIYQMETDPRRIEILNQIQIKQDEIYKLEELREAALLKIRDLEDKIWKIEENSIEPLQERIDLLNYENKILQDSIDKKIEGLRVLGKTRDEWNRINAQLDAQAAALKAANGSAALAGLLSAAQELELTWSNILALLAQYANGVPGAVQNAMNAIGGVGATAYVAPQETAETEAAAAAFDATVEALDAAMAAYEEAVASGNMYAVRNAGIALTAAQEAYDATLPTGTSNGPGADNRTASQSLSSGGIVKPKYFAVGGVARGTDIVPAMLTPGEFVMSRYAVQSHGIDKMKSINNGSSVGDSVYNYSISVNVKSDADANEIARAVMTQIKSVDSQKLRGARF